MGAIIVCAIVAVCSFIVGLNLMKNYKREELLFQDNRIKETEERLKKSRDEIVTLKSKIKEAESMVLRLEHTVDTQKATILKENSTIKELQNKNKFYKEAHLLPTN